jgi:hypothetical protein
MPPTAAGNPRPGPGARTAIQLRPRSAGQTRPARRATYRAAAVTGWAALAAMAVAQVVSSRAGDGLGDPLLRRAGQLPAQHQRQGGEGHYREIRRGRPGRLHVPGRAARRPARRDGRADRHPPPRAIPFPPAGPYSRITDAAARATPALPGRQRTHVSVGYPQAAYLVLAA